LNRLAPVWQLIFKHLLEGFLPVDCNLNVSLVDSFPIVACKGRKGKVAREIADKGFCSTKNRHNYRLTLHNLGFRRKGTIPFPEMLAFSALPKMITRYLYENLTPNVQQNSVCR
jgi:hypothetical protein